MELFGLRFEFDRGRVLMEGFAKALGGHALGFPTCMVGKELARSTQNKLRFRITLLKLSGNGLFSSQTSLSVALNMDISLTN